MAHDIEQVRAALAAYRERYGHDAVQNLNAKFGPLSRMPEKMFGQVIAATKLAPGSFEMSGHGDNVDPWHRKGAEVNEQANQFWESRREADKAKIPAHEFAPKSEEKSR